MGYNIGVRGVLAFVCLLGLAAETHAQKPIGLFDHECDVPAWASFGQLAEWDDFAVAADCSRRTGRTWVLVLFHADSYHVSGVRTRALETGLAPYILALTYREEPYQHLRLNLSLPLALEDRLAAQPEADMATRLNIVRDHWSEAHAMIKAVWPGPILAFITPWTNDSLAYGEPLYSPLPDGVDVLVLDPYATDGMPFTAWPEVVIQYAVQTTTLPIALVPQWFTQPGTSISQPRDFTVDYMRWLRHPRVVALWGFLWASRGPGLVGLRDLPALRASVESALKGRR
jgi:hypothetical protein